MLLESRAGVIIAVTRWLLEEEEEALEFLGEDAAYGVSPDGMDPSNLFLGRGWALCPSSMLQLCLYKMSSTQLACSPDTVDDDGNRNLHPACICLHAEGL